MLTWGGSAPRRPCGRRWGASPLWDLAMHRSYICLQLQVSRCTVVRLRRRRTRHARPGPRATRRPTREPWSMRRPSRLQAPPCAGGVNPAATDSAGRFTYADLPLGSYTCAQAGADFLSRSVELTSGSAPVEITLPPVDAAFQVILF